MGIDVKQKLSFYLIKFVRKISVKFWVQKTSSEIEEYRRLKDMEMKCSEAGMMGSLVNFQVFLLQCHDKMHETQNIVMCLLVPAALLLGHIHEEENEPCSFTSHKNQQTCVSISERWTIRKAFSSSEDVKSCILLMGYLCEIWYSCHFGIMGRLLKIKVTHREDKMANTNGEAISLVMFICMWLSECTCLTAFIIPHLNREIPI